MALAPTPVVPKRLDPEDLRNTTQDRLVLSLMVDADFKIQTVAVKFIMFDGSEELVYMQGTTALMLLDHLRKPFRTRRYTDRRRSADDPLPDEPLVENFLAMQPDILEEEWNNIPQNRLTKGIQAFEFDNAFIFVISLSDGNEYRYIVPDQVSLYMLEYFEQLKEDIKDTRKP